MRGLRRGVCVKFFVICLMITALLGCGGAGSTSANSQQDISPAPGSEGGGQSGDAELLKLVGTWFTVEPDDEGLRYAITFTAKSDAPSVSALNFHFFQVEVDGSDIGGLDGEATREGSILKLNFPGFDPLEDSYKITSTELSFGDIRLTKLTGNIPALEGSGGLGGVISVSRAGTSTGIKGSFVPGQVIVKYKEGSQTALITGGRAEVVELIPGIGSVIEKEGTQMAGLQISQKRGAAALKIIGELARWTISKVRELSENPNVKFVQPNYIFHPTAVPTDPYYSAQWHYPLIDLPNAWDITTGSDDMVVAVVDTGILNHPDLAGRITNTGFDFVDTRFSNDGDGPDADPTDPGDGQGGRGNSWHGTHVAGTIAAATNNGLGVSGILWSGSVMAVRVMGAGGGASADIANGILYAAGLANSSGKVPDKTARVINLSLGGPGFDFVIDQAVADAVQAGVVVVAAAGNENTSDFGSPGTSPGAITVAAVGLDSSKAPYSNFGPEVDVAAPGGDMSVDLDGNDYPDGVLSTLAKDDGSPVYTFYQGTSMATPHVVGVVGLMLSANPNLTPAEVLNILSQTATDLGDPGRDDVFGAGLINAAKAVQAAKGVPANGPRLRLSSPSVSLSKETTQGTVLVDNGGAGTINGLQAVVSGVTGGNWLQAKLDGVSTPAKLSISAITTGLADGSYTGKVQVTGSVGSAEVTVTLNIDSQAAVQSNDVYIVALDPKTEEPLYLTQALNDSSYGFVDLPVGTYLLVASTDLNNDGIICDETEFCGGFPVLSWLEPVPVIPNVFLTGVNFSIGRYFELQSVKNPARAISIEGLRNKQ